jgi:hypothetical protein
MPSLLSACIVKYRQLYLYLAVHEGSSIPAKDENTRCILHLHTLDHAAGIKDNHSEMISVTQLIHTRVRMCIRAEGGNFEQLK